MNPISGRKRDREEFESVDLSRVPRVVPKDSCCNSIWVITNEMGNEDILMDMRKTAIVGDTIIGVSGFYTLDLAVQRGASLWYENRKIEQIVIIDHGIAVSHFWNGIAKIVRKCTKRESAIEKIKTFLIESDSFFSVCKTGRHESHINCQIKELQWCIDYGISWLSNDTWYKQGKAFFDQNRIKHIVSDLCDPNTMDGVVRAITQAGHTVDTVYLSNVLTVPYEPYNKDPKAAEKVRSKVPATAITIEAIRCQCNDECHNFKQIKR
jgi:hypothetical protein